MSNIYSAESTDILLYMSADTAGQKEAEDFLKLKDSFSAGKRVYTRILKRIRHPKNYSNGKMRRRAKLKGVLLTVILILLFISLGYACARLTADFTSGKYTFSSSEKNTDCVQINEITCFRSPVIEGAEEQVLVRSSLIYNAEYKTKDCTVYYTQLPKSSDIEELQKNDDGIYIYVNGQCGSISKISADGERIFELVWSDENHTYIISGAKELEDIINISKSVYESR